MRLGIVTTDGDLITHINMIGTVGSLGEPITEANLPAISEDLRESLERQLNILNKSPNKYKVNSFKVAFLKNVGSHVHSGEDVFSYTTTITEPNGNVITKEGTLGSGYIDTL